VAAYQGFEEEKRENGTKNTVNTHTGIVGGVTLRNPASSRARITT
jgi:hypothetical protein